MLPTSHRIFRLASLVIALTAGAHVLVACGEDSSTPTPSSPSISLGDAGFIDEGEYDASKPVVDGGFVGPEGVVIREDRFVMDVVSFTPGSCSGFGASQMPDIVKGPPVGTGSMKGSFDVVSLGIGGEIVLSFGSNAIVDGPGADFIVFENAFYAAGNATQPAADPGEVSVSEDGVTWKTYECAPGPDGTYGKCAGWHPVFSAPGNGISPTDPAVSGGEAYDLAELGMTTARFVRIRDKSTETCEGQPPPNNIGFDLDAVALVHAAMP